MVRGCAVTGLRGCIVLFLLAWQFGAGVFSGLGFEMKTRAERESTTLRNRSAIATGSVKSNSNSTATSDGGQPHYTIQYTFPLPDGRRYAGHFECSQDDRPEVGSAVSVRYDPNDPDTHEALGHEDEAPIWFVYAASGFLCVLPLLTLFQKRTNAAPFARRFVAFGLLVAVGLVGHFVGRKANLFAGNTYTVQDGDTVMSGLWMTGGAHSVDLSSRGLTIAGQKFGQVPNHSHIWIRGKDVLLNGRPFGHLKQRN